MTHIRGFKLVFTTLGVAYVLMASSMLVRGVGALRDFAVPESSVSDPVLADIFMFFYVLMAFIGVLMMLFGFVTRDRKWQTLVAAVFCASQLVCMYRDLQTSDSRFGNHLYKGDATLVFVYIGLLYTAAFGFLTVRGFRGRTLRAPGSGALDA
jgi:hypothetical protein